MCIARRPGWFPTLATLIGLALLWGLSAVPAFCQGGSGEPPPVTGSRTGTSPNHVGSNAPPT